MTYVVTENCIRCKYTHCVGVCPVDCFREGPTMLVIDPEVCIDCGVCVPECPVEAIVPDNDPVADAYADLNRDYAGRWPAINKRKDPPADADEWRDVPDKLKQHFNPAA